MILDLEGTPRARTAPRLGWTLSLASASVAAAALLVLSALPHDQVARLVPSGPSVIGQAFARARTPTLSLQLPSDIATEIPPLRVDGIYGPPRPEPRIRSFRMRGTNDLVVVAMLPEDPPIYRPAHAPADSPSVHGAYAASHFDDATSISAIRWTEHGMTYEISSRALLPGDLARLAEQVR